MNLFWPLLNLWTWVVKRAKVKFKNFCWDALMKMDESDVLEGLAVDPH